MPRIINWDLAANPYNWIIVALMLMIAVFGLRAILPSGDGAGSGVPILPNGPLADGSE